MRAYTDVTNDIQYFIDGIDENNKSLVFLEDQMTMFI